MGLCPVVGIVISGSLQKLEEAKTGMRGSISGKTYKSQKWGPALGWCQGLAVATLQRKNRWAWLAFRCEGPGKEAPSLFNWGSAAKDDSVFTVVEDIWGQ